MADPVTTGAILKAAAKVAAALGMEPEKILQVILLAFLFPVAILAIFFVVPVAMVETVPMAQPAHVQFYVDAAKEVNDEYGLSVKWQELLALDAVLLDQDFSQSSKARAKSLAELFVQEEIEKADDESEEEEKVVYSQLSLEKVMGAIGVSSKRQSQVAMFLFFDLAGLRGGGLSVPSGWVPNSWGRFVWPLPDGFYAVTSTFGPRVLGGSSEFHAGLDVGAPRGTPVLAADSGTVTYADWMGTAGRAVIIQHTGGYETRYYHLNSIGVRAGEEVRAGQMVGTVGSTGRSTGNHLHFEVRRWGNAVDPLSFY